MENNKKVEYIQLGNTGFRVGMCKDLSFEKFRATYAGVLQGYDLKKAFIELGGKIKTKASK